MTKEAIQEALALSKGFPIKVVCDNMLIYQDNNDMYQLHNDIQFPNIIWDHTKERFICIRPNTQPEQSQLPIDVSIVPYEQIQYMQIFLDVKTSTTVINEIETMYQDSEYAISDSQKAIITAMLTKLVLGIPYKAGPRPTYEHLDNDGNKITE